MEKYVRKVQLIELEILKEVDRICKKNDIKYFLCNGTLIGAIRHKGFIPWDDDIDLVMTRKNYKKFIKACKKDLKDKYLIDCYETNKKWCHPFIKIKKKNTLYVEARDYNTYDENSGIWVDIFPIDGCKKPLGKFHLFQYKMYSYITTLITIKNGSNYYKNSKVKKKIYQTILKIVPMKFMVWLLYLFICHYDEDKVDYLTQFTTVYGLNKETFKKELVCNYMPVTFEDGKFSGLKNYDEYLRQIYGDYMKLPPKEKRVNHNPYLVRFEDGEEYKFELDDKWLV